jgi:hypothetical protein
MDNSFIATAKRQINDFAHDTYRSLEELSNENGYDILKGVAQHIQEMEKLLMESVESKLIENRNK